jgi:WD40 repeat protein/DNA-binding SARP family transcriptional activator/energy-coupling factor transporter ATP-binding protein EcfA2
MVLGVLGPLELDGEAAGLSPRDRLVLLALAVRRGDVLPADQLADALWTDHPPASATKVVQGCIARLRKRLGAAAIVTIDHGYRLTLAAEAIDVGRFERAIQRARELSALGEHDRAAAGIDDALALWRGQPFEGLESWEPARFEAHRLRELRSIAEELRLEALLGAGRWTEVLDAAPRSVADAPLRERRWALLATAQYQDGRQADALETLRRARQHLAEELGVDPGPDLLALEAAILRQDPALAGRTPLPEVATTCPYPGLLAYQEEDADRFFGRDADVRACLRRLEASGVLAVVGPSGSGKSSLVRAGVVPALHTSGHDLRLLTPGSQPLDALARHAPPASRASDAARRTGTGAPSRVLVFDQFEEAFTRCVDTQERTRFLDAVAHAADHSWVVIALRADKLGELAAHRDLAALVERGLHLITGMTSGDLRTAIEEPARRAGLLLEAGLADLLLRDVEDEPGALPLLSHALRQTWLARDGRTLTVSGYRTAGGIRGAAAQTAEKLYEASSDDQRAVLRDLLLRLVTPSLEGEPVRARVPRRLVTGTAARAELVERLVDARLLTSDAETVELAHEALVRAWPRLRAWLDDDVEGQRTLRHLAVSAHSWDELGRPDTELYRGVRLERAVLWRQQSRPDLTPVERDFLDTSVARRDAEVAATRRRRQLLVGALAAVAFLGGALGSVAVVQARRAADERDRALLAEADAEGQAELARSRELAASAIAVLDDDPELSLLLSLEAARGSDPSLQAVRAVHEAIREHRVLTTITVDETALTPTPDPTSVTAALSPDGRLLAIGGAAGGTAGDPNAARSLEVWDVAGRRRLWGSGDVGLVLGPPRFSSDGRQLVAPAYPAREADEPGDAEEVGGDGEEAGGPPGLYTWDAHSGGEPEVRELGLDCPATEIVTGPYPELQGSLVVAAFPDATTCADGDESPRPITFTALEPGSDEPRELWTEPHGWFAATTSGDGRFLAVSALTTRVLDVATGEEVLALPLEGSLVALDPDGSQLLVTNIAAPTELWDVRTGELLRTVHEHDDLRGEERAWFSADGTVIGSATFGGEVRLSDASTGRPLPTLRGHKGWIVSASMPSDGGTLATAANDGTVKVWSLVPRGEVGTIGYEAGAPSGSLSVANGRVAIAGEEPTAVRSDDTFRFQVVDLTSEAVVSTIGAVTGQLGTLSPDGARFAAQQKVDGDTFGGIRIHDATSGEVLTEVDGLCAYTEADIGEGTACGVEPPGAPNTAWTAQLRFSPDGSRLAMVNGRHSSVHVWDTGTGEALLTTPSLSESWWPAATFGPDGSWLAVMSDTELVVHDTGTWSVVARQDHEERGIRATRASADGRHLVAATQDARLAVYDTGTWTRVGPAWVAHEGQILDLEVAWDSRSIVSASNDGTLKVWELPSGRLLQTIPIGGPARNVEFVADRHVLASTPGPLSIFTLDLGELLDIARDRLTRGFAPEECLAYDLDPCPSLAAVQRG